MKKSPFTLTAFFLLIATLNYATSITSNQDGDWATPSTWNGGIIPTDGDDVTIDHNIILSSNQTIGIGSGTAILVNDNGTLLLHPNIVINVKGNILASGTITLSAGADIYMNTSTPSFIQLTPGTTMAHLQINGSSNQHCTIQAIGSAHTRITDNDELGGGRVVANYCDFSKLGGSPDYRAISYHPIATGEHFSYNHCNFDLCSKIKVNNNYFLNIPAGAYIEFSNCKWTNSIRDPNIDPNIIWETFETWSNYGVTFKLLDCDFDKRVGLIRARDLEIENCVFREGILGYNGIYFGGIYQSFKHNFVNWVNEEVELTIEFGNTLEDCIFIKDTPASWNPHYIVTSGGTGAFNFINNIVWFTGTHPNSEGDGLMIGIPGSGTRAENIITMERNIFLPNGNGPEGDNTVSATGFSLLFESDYDKQIVVKRNTFYASGWIGGLNLGENQWARTGDLSYVKSNLFVGSDALGGSKISDIGYCEQDVFLAPNVDYNGGYHLLNAEAYDANTNCGKGYDSFNYSGDSIVGAHDVDDMNPMFVDPTRSPASWSGDLSTTMDWLSPEGGHEITELLDYIREGFRPQNEFFKDAGDPTDGSPDIGAVDITTTVNINPEVTLTAPDDGKTYLLGNIVELAAESNDIDGTISKVEFFANGTKIGEDTTSPYSYSWTDASIGSYTLSAVTTDNDGGTANSNSRFILITDLSQTIVVNDIGDDDDFNHASEIYFNLYWWESNFNIPAEDANFINQEIGDDYWIFTSAPDQNDPQLIKSRSLRMTANAEFLPLAIGQAGDSLYLSIRYKDNISTFYGAQPIYAFRGNNQWDWVQIGTIGGAFDHQWKTEIFSIPKTNLMASENRYRFKIGTGVWGSGLKAPIPIDLLELATTRAALSDNPDVAGCYPNPEDGNYQNFNSNTPWYDNNGQAIFPTGIAAGWTGMSPAKFQAVADAQFDVLIFYNWMDYYAPYAAGDVWDSLPSAEHYGFGEFLDACQDVGLKTIGVFQNDVKYFPVQDYFGSESACLDYISAKVTQHKDHPALLAWSPVDEPDHSHIPPFYAPVEWILGVKKAIREADPNHPIFALEMGWRAGAFGHFEDIADYQGYDEYPQFGASLTSISDGITQFYNETNNRKPLTMYLKSYERTAAQSYMSLGEAYLSLIYGVNGIFYWDLEGSQPLTPVLTQINSEINALETNVLLPPASFVDRNGMNGICTDDSESVQHALKTGADNLSYLLAVNTENQDANNIHFTIDELDAGVNINVLFENRTITSDNGSFTDDFGGYGRHVYQIPGLPLAVKYLNPLKARIELEQIILDWQTSNEIDNQLFEVEKINKENKWVKIGFVLGKNDEGNQYIFVDKNPVIGNNTYRLRQIDLDGHFTYSNIVTIIYNKLELIMFPNPTRGELFFGIRPNNKLTDICIYNKLGQKIMSKVVENNKIDISALPVGIYMVEVSMDSGIVRKKIIKIE